MKQPSTQAIRDLANEAVVHGDDTQAAICASALRGDREALAVCQEVMDAAAAMSTIATIKKNQASCQKPW